jgi:hypothetical protein
MCDEFDEYYEEIIETEEVEIGGLVYLTGDQNQINRRESERFIGTYNILTDSIDFKV